MVCFTAKSRDAANKSTKQPRKVAAVTPLYTEERQETEPAEVPVPHQSQGKRIPSPPKSAKRDRRSTKSAKQSGNMSALLGEKSEERTEMSADSQQLPEDKKSIIQETRVDNNTDQKIL